MNKICYTQQISLNQKSQIPFSYRTRSLIFSTLPPQPSLLFCSSAVSGCSRKQPGPQKEALPRGESTGHPGTAQNVKPPIHGGPAGFLRSGWESHSREQGRPHATLEQLRRPARDKGRGRQGLRAPGPPAAPGRNVPLAGLRPPSIRPSLVRGTAATFLPTRPATRSAPGRRGCGSPSRADPSLPQ